MYINTDLRYDGINNHIRIPEIVIEHVPINIDIDRHYVIDTQPNVHINDTVVEASHIVDVVV